MTLDRAMSGPRFVSAPSAWNSGIQVLPSWATSGVELPTDLLHANANARVLALELRDELGDLFALRAHGPEADLDLAGAFRAAAGERKSRKRHDYPSRQHKDQALRPQSAQRYAEGLRAA
jgi:hypothetical protein